MTGPRKQNLSTILAESCKRSRLMEVEISELKKKLDEQKKRSTLFRDALFEAGWLYCCKCDSVKPSDDFCNNAIRKNGKSHECKECRKEYSAEYQSDTKRRKKQIQYMKDYRKL